MMRRALGFLSRFAILATMLVMWYPQRHVSGVDLGNNLLQSGLFALCMFMRALSRGGRLRSDPYFEFRSAVWELDAAAVARNIVAIVIEMLVLAAVLEIGQALLSRRHSAAGDFFLNALAVTAVGAVVYLLFALALRTPPGKRLAQLLMRID